MKMNQRKGAAILWNSAPKSVLVTVRDGGLANLKIVRGDGVVEGQFCRFRGHGEAVLEVECCPAHTAPGSPATIVSVSVQGQGFSFFLRDVASSCPILMPERGATIVPAGNGQSYAQVLAAVRGRGGLTKLQRIALEPEESYAAAAANTRPLYTPTTLGLGRDMRLFEIDSRTHVNRVESMTFIRPLLATRHVLSPETNNLDLFYAVTVGRGIGCALPQSRRLEDGVLPILRQRIEDEEVVYDMAFFCSLESGPIAPGAVRGTHYLVADGHSGGHHFTEEQAAAFWEHLAEDTSRGMDETLDAGIYSPAPTDADREKFKARWNKVEHRAEETILVCRIKASNTSSVPRYAWMTAPHPQRGVFSHDPSTGFGAFASGNVFCIGRLEDQPFPGAELPILLQPGGSVATEFIIPHRPVSRERAERLYGQQASEHHSACRAYWRSKLERGARIDLPEWRINEMIRANRLQLEMVMYGREPDGVIAPSCGRQYSPLCPESAAMIQFLDSANCPDLAARCLEFFLAKQHPDGMMRNFNGHQSEPGAVLWSFAEHFRYTRDEQWLAQRLPQLMKTANLLLNWRARNMRAELRGRGYGLIDGQWGDMAESFHGFGLNAIALRGVMELADVLRDLRHAEAGRLEREGAEWKKDLLEAVERSMAEAPLVPLGDGTWVPSLAPWPESGLPACLDGAAKKWTHGTFLARDNAMPSALVFHGLMSPDDPRAASLLRYVTDLYHVRNVRHSQPYISWHPWIHLRRGEVKAFLKSYYNTLASLADRETYSFWEHFYGACPHKTESMGAFLMQTRWMLWMERGRSLELLPGVPRAWLEGGKRIEIENAATYFGPLSLSIESRLGSHPDSIVARYALPGARRPVDLRLRLPHPTGLMPRAVKGGVFQPDTECVLIENPGQAGEVALDY